MQVAEPPNSVHHVNLMSSFRYTMRLPGIHSHFAWDAEFPTSSVESNGLCEWDSDIVLPM
jgi:hypothetical protein